MSFILLGILNSAAGGPSVGPYFMSTYGNSSIGVANAIALDSNSNAYLYGQGYSGTYQTQFTSYDSVGVPRFAKAMNANGNDNGYGLAVDSGDNILAAGYFQQSGQVDSHTRKWNSSGVLQWQRKIATTGEDEGRAVGVDSSDNVYTLSWGISGYGARDYHVHKRNSAGTLQWQRSIGSGNTDYATKMAVSSSGDVYCNGYTSNVSLGGDDWFLIKYNSSGTLQWQRRIGGSSNDYGSGVGIDNDGYPIFVGQTSSEGAGGYDAVITKCTTGGSIIWQRRLGDSGNNSFAEVAVDSENNYVCVGGNDNNNLLIAKYDSSGNLLLQRNIDAVGVITANSVTVDANDDWWIGANTNGAGAGNYDQTLLYLPGDGSRTQTWTIDGADYTYSAGSLTAATSTLSEAATSFSEGSASWTDGTTSYTAGNWTLTQYITLI